VRNCGELITVSDVCTYNKGSKVCRDMHCVKTIDMKNKSENTGVSESWRTMLLKFVRLEKSEECHHGNCF
jgi:hypothetical protein